MGSCEPSHHGLLTTDQGLTLAAVAVITPDTRANGDLTGDCEPCAVACKTCTAQSVPLQTTNAPHPPGDAAVPPTMPPANTIPLAVPSGWLRATEVTAREALSPPSRTLESATA